MPVDRHRIPPLGVADVVDRHVVVLAPEERHRVEPLAAAQHVARGHLTLPLRDHPVLDADRSPVCGSGHRATSPAAKIPGALVSRNSLTAMPRSTARPAVSASAVRRPDADAHDDEVGVERAPAAQGHASSVDRGHRLAQVEDDAVRSRAAR